MYRSVYTSLTLFRPRSRDFKRTSRTQSAQNYFRISTWSPHIISPIYCQMKKIGKVNELGVWIHHTLCEKKKAYHISITTSLLSKAEKLYVSQEYQDRWLKMCFYYWCGPSLGPRKDNSEHGIRLRIYWCNKIERKVMV